MNNIVGGIMNQKILMFLFLFIFLFCCTDRVAASPPAKMTELTCPICKTKFTTGVSSGGGFISTQRLDMKPIGPISAPNPRPVCPKDHFVFYKYNLTEKEAEHLRSFINSQEYQGLVKDYPHYYLIAKIYEFLGESEFKIAYTYLQASWEVEKSSRDQYEQCLKASLEHYQKFLSNNKEKGKAQETAELLSGEIERRLGSFDDAKKRFKRLKNLSEFNAGFYSGVIKLQLVLIQDRDSGPHEIPREE
jgi:uncharacterized protein (DUF2225 family)